MFWFRAVLLLALLTPCDTFAWTGEVVSVHDGDSLKVQRVDDGHVVSVRIFGVDCPELAQPYGDDARLYTARLLAGQSVEVLPSGQRPSFGREVAVIEYNERTLQELLSEAGFAWVDGRFCKSEVCDAWRKLQNIARSDKRGLWADPSPIPPWVWRHQMRK